MTWRSSFRNSGSCDQTTINSGGQVGAGGNIECGSTCDPRVVDSSVICTDFNSPSDWASGVNTATFRLSTATATLR